MMIDGSIRVCLESFGVWMKDTIGRPKKKKIQIIIEFQLMVSASDDNFLSSD